MAGLYSIPRQNAHSVFPRDGAEEGVENGKVIVSPSIECTFCIPQRGCKGGGGKWQGYNQYLKQMHVQYSPERVQRTGWKMIGL